MKTMSVVAAVLAASQLSHAGVIDSYVTNLGNAELSLYQTASGNVWSPWDRAGNNVSYSYGSGPDGNWDLTIRTWLEVALPSLTGTITDAMLYVNVTGFSVTPAGDAALLYSTDSSSLTGNATDGFGGNDLVSIIDNPATGWLGFDATSFIFNDYSHGDLWAGFQVVPATSGRMSTSSFSFSIAAPGSTPESPGNAPYLEITFASGGPEGQFGVPEPTTIGLTALGGAFLLFAMRRKQKDRLCARI